MPNTFTQIHFQFMFPVKYKLATLQPPWDEELRKYITGIFRNNGHKMLAINNVEDHIHIFGGLSPDQSISNLMRDVKSSSTVWINDNKFTSRPFQWQTGYGAFSYSKSDIDSVVKYIQNQKEFHKTVSFDEEFKEFLRIFGVIYEDRYLFHPLLEG